MHFDNDAGNPNDVPNILFKYGDNLIAEDAERILNAVFIASMNGYWKLWPFPFKLLAGLNWIMLPILARLFGYFPGKRLGIMEDLPKGVAIEWARWGRSPNYLFDHVEEAWESFTQVKVPLLSYSFSDDTTAPKNTVEWLNARYENCSLNYKHIEPASIGLDSIGHFGFFRKKCRALWEDLLEEIQRWPD